MKYGEQKLHDVEEEARAVQLLDLLPYTGRVRVVGQRKRLPVHRELWMPATEILSQLGEHVYYASSNHSDQATSTWTVLRRAGSRGHAPPGGRGGTAVGCT